MSFKKQIKDFDWQSVEQSIYGKSEKDVEKALASKNRNLEDFKALISPAAVPYLEQMAQLSNRLTQERLGKQYSFIFLYIYLMNAKIFVLIVALV